jgi:hypothetical protein
MLAESLSRLSATNIDTDQLMFELNPQHPDGRVRLTEWLDKLWWGDAPCADAEATLRDMDRESLFASVMGALTGKGMDRAKASRTVIKPLSKEKKAAAEVVRSAREAFKTRGFANVAELFVWVDAEGRDYVTCQVSRPHLCVVCTG